MATDEDEWWEAQGEDGKVYYYKDTGETTWETPEHYHKLEKIQHIQEWWEAQGEDGKVYYFNATGQTTWETPENYHKLESEAIAVEPEWDEGPATQEDAPTMQGAQRFGPEQALCSLKNTVQNAPVKKNNISVLVSFQAKLPESPLLQPQLCLRSSWRSQSLSNRMR